jgi:hypothetical protein
MALPGSVNIEVKQIFQKEYSEVLGQRHKKKVFIGSNEIEARKAALIAGQLGYENIAVLCGGMDNFVKTVILKNPEAKKHKCDFQVLFAGNSMVQSLQKDPLQEKDTDRFRTKASVTLTSMIREAKSSAVKPVKLVKKVAGGC